MMDVWTMRSMYFMGVPSQVFCNNIVCGKRVEEPVCSRLENTGVQIKIYFLPSHTS